MQQKNVVGAVSKPTPEELVSLYETFDDGQSKEIRRQLKEGALHTRNVQELIEHRVTATPAETIDSQIVFWTGFYAVLFEMDAKADLIKLHWPDPDPDFWDVPMVKGLTETGVLKALKQWNRFLVASYYGDPSAELVAEENARHPSRGTYGVRFRADPEGDEDQKNISANRHKELGTNGNTPLEAEVLEPMYFLKSGGRRHLNEKTVNHAIGSRFSDGLVPFASWRGGFYLGGGSPPGGADPRLRARVAVVTF